MPGIPWQLILRQTPSLLKAASSLLDSSRRRPADIDGANDLHALRDRVAELAKDQQAYADLVKQLTDHIDALTEVTQATAARARQAMLVGGAGIALGLVGCVLALVR